MIRAEALVKRYGELTAVDGVSFEVTDGEIYGLLGPNGAGKTTTLSMFAGLLQPDEGRILFGDVDMATEPIAIKRKLGVVPQEIALYEDLTGRENLRFWGGLYGLSGRALDDAVAGVLERVGLTGKADTRVGRYSGGMKRRLNLGLGLVHSPAVVLMDEPTVGIDPQARERILQVVRDVAASGSTVLYTTHYLEEAERFCDRIGILDHGKILAEGTLDELVRMLGDGDLITVHGGFAAAAARERLGRLEKVEILAADDGRAVLSARSGGRGAVEALGSILDSGLDVEAVAIQPPSLNSLFLKMTGRALRD